MALWPIDKIKISGRTRKDYGDLESLAESISQVGLLQEICVNGDGELIAGARRLKALRLLIQRGETKWSAVPVYVCKHLTDAVDKLMAERDENTERKAFTPEEAVRMGELLEKLCAPDPEKIREKQREGGKKAGKGRPGDRSPVKDGRPKSVGRRDSETSAKAASGVGLGQSTYERAKKVISAADANPALRPIVDEMNATGNVTAALRKLKEHGREQKRQRNAEQVATTDDVSSLSGVFSTIVVDPPWDWGDEGDVNQLGRAKPDYATLSIEQLLAMDVESKAADDCHLYCWVTNRSLPKVFGLVERWGFRYVTLLTWPKPSIGMGNYFRGQTEHVVFGVRGSLGLKVKDAATLLPQWKRGTRHSEKPAEFLAFVERCSPGPYLEIFARSKRDGWSSWGADA